jgi:serine/threonine protein kinase/Flp pilus assembly protein TadD
MATWNPEANDIFLKAFEIAPPEERRAFLDRACGSEAGLRAQVESLLEASEQAGSFLESPAVAAVAPVQQPGKEEPGTLIGPYRLLEQIGEGAFGIVFMAKQDRPVRRKVALKVLKPGMDTRQVVARFEAERQALALMDHENIAKVFDAGEAASGRPYFVMELVRGTPITDYCDQSQLALRQRLELFVAACHAVQHAHQKGIIHRDLKPSNVLVTLHDGMPVVKVIDFGIAKALGQRLTDKTLFTGFAQMIGTPLYMSPEQAELSGLDIDTRSDVYSLGVLLYELLTGTTPLEKGRMSEVGYDELRRLIREEEPPKPSTRVSTLGPAAATVSAHRQSDPRRLSQLFRGELDWIVMKALEKDRIRRYETVSALAADLQRYLHDEPVLACPPSAWYRLRKFARRNKGKVAVAGLILFFLVLLGVGGGWVALDRATRRAKASHDLELALQGAELYLGQGKQADARAGLDQAERIASELKPDSARDQRLAGLRERLRAEEQDQQFLAGYEDIRLRVETQVDVVNNRFARQAVFPEVRELFRQYGITFVDTPPDQAVARIQNRPEPVRQQLVAALYNGGHNAPKDDTRTSNWLQALLEAADTDSWRVNIRKAIAARDWKAVEQQVRAVDVTKQPPGFLVQFAEILPVEQKAVRLDFLHMIQRAYPADLWANHGLAMELARSGRQGEAIRYFTAALALRPDNPGININRGRCLAEAKEMDAAIADYERALALAPNYFAAFANLGDALRAQGRLQDMLAVDNQAVQACPDRADAWSNRALAYVKLDEFEKAIADSTRAIDLDPKLAAAWANRGSAYRLLGQYDKAIADCTKAIELDEKHAGAFSDRANAYLQLGQYEKALADCSRSIQLDSTDAFTWYTRGNVHQALGEHEKALADCSKAVELAPQNPWTHGNLGDVLTNMDRARDAVAAYRKAIAIDKGIAEFHCALAGALQKQGEFQKALEEMRRGHELRSKRPFWPHPSAQWVRQCERLAELDLRLPGFLEGKTAPASPAERIELAGLCSLKRLNRAAVRFYEEAFAAEPKLADDLDGGHRYNAACAAALAGCGQGKDASKLADKERHRLRCQALDWLRADLKSRRLLQEKDANKTSPTLLGQMRHWLGDPDFVGVRGPEALAKLPEAERHQWQKLWKDVADMVKPAQQKPASEKKRVGSGFEP